MPVQCSRCGVEWPRDPALEVPCPRCGVTVGVKCRRPSQHGVFGGQPHAERDRAAMEAGLLVKCAGSRPEPTKAPCGNPGAPQLTLPMEAA